MARSACDIVKGARAAWICPHCDAHYSEHCIPDGFNPLWGRSGPTCIACHSLLLPASDPSLAKPFWHVLPYLFLMPLHPYALMVIALGAGGVAVLGPGLPGQLYAAVFAVVALKYFFALVRERSRGKRWPPNPVELARPDPHWLFLQAVGVNLLFAAVVAGAFFLHPWAALAMAALVVLVFPASTAILALEKSMLQALNPAALFGLIGAMGAYYLLLWLLVALLGLASAGVGYWLYPQLPPDWHLAASTAVGTYFSLVIYALMGYALYQYSDELGVVREDIGPQLDETAFRRARALGAVRVLEARGELGRARSELRQLLDICRDDLALHRQYQRLLCQCGDAEALARHTDYLAGLLLDNGGKAGRREAARWLMDTAAQLPEYRCRSLATLVALAPALERGGHHQWLARCLQNAHKSHPDDPQLPAAYLILAKLLAGPLGQPSKARQLAAFMLKKAPEAPEAKAFARLARG